MYLGRHSAATLFEGLRLLALSIPSVGLACPSVTASPLTALIMLPVILESHGVDDAARDISVFYSRSPGTRNPYVSHAAVRTADPDKLAV